MTMCNQYENLLHMVIHLFKCHIDYFVYGLLNNINILLRKLTYNKSLYNINNIMYYY